MIFDMTFDSSNIRQEFPILCSKECFYLDYAATMQKPLSVMSAVDSYYKNDNANVHRGMHTLAERATNALEDARKSVAKFISSAPYEIVFTKNATEALNLIAKSWGHQNLTERDSIVLTVLEHHSNIVPWLQLQQDIGFTIHWVDIREDGTLNMNQLDEYLASETVRLVSLTGQSNVLGVCPPLREIIQKCHAVGTFCAVDAAQLIAHQQVNVAELDCDFLVFSGHKVYGPTGIGVLYAKKEHLESMPPFLGGGMMIQEVTMTEFTPAEIPAKFEAGTPPIAQAVGLKAAIDWLSQYEWKDILKHEEMLMAYAIEKLHTIEGLTILGQPSDTLPSGCISFIVHNIHPHDLTEIIGRNGVSMRAGHHCAQPLHDRLEINASTRLSLAIYNTKEDIDHAVEEILKAILVLQK